MKHFTPRLLIALASVCAGVGASAGADEAATPVPGVYVIDVTIAPACLVGSFPLTVQTDAGPLPGTLDVTTDIRGRLSGALALGGATFDVMGRASSTARAFKMSMAARSGRDRIAFSGTLTGQSFGGFARGRGTVAAGRHSFALDVSSAGPETATLVASLVAGRRGAVAGTGTVTSCGSTAALKASGSTRRTFRFALATKGFKFRGAGAGPLSWNLKGFGASASGEGLTLDPLPAPAGLAYGAPTATFEEEVPVDPDFPTTFMPRYTTFSVTPALPSGLSLDPTTGVISGTPTAESAASDFTVTASNFAGSAQTTLTFGVLPSRARSFAARTDALDDDDLRHFLRRTQYGIRAGEINALRTDGLAAYVDAMLAFPATTPAETNANALLAHATDPPGQSGLFPTLTDLARWWTQIMVDTPAPFQETLAFFWHDHFGVDAAVMTDQTRWMVNHVNLLRSEGAGNLRTLLLDVARDPAMLAFLDGFTNTDNRPNENFAREFWELFTLGVDNGYTQADIAEASRAWTGWRRTTNPQTGLYDASFSSARHDPGSKSILGQTIPGQNAGDDFAAVVDFTLQHRKVAEYVTKKLFEHFCYENPPQPLVDTMAAYLRAQNYELTPFLKSLFKSEAFFSKKSRRNLVKSPLEFTLGFLRSTGLRPTTSAGALDVATLDNSLTTQSQRPTQPPTVAGWPTGDLWLSAQSMVERINLVRACVDDTAHQAAAGFDLAGLLPPVPQRTADAVVDALAQILDVQLSTQDRADLILYLNTQRDTSGNTTSSPFDGSSQAHIDERARGVLYILAQHPTYHSR